MRILMTSNLLPPDYDGGQEVNALKIACALRERGHDVQMATSRFREEYTGSRDVPEWVHRVFNYHLRPHVRSKFGPVKKVEGLWKLWEYERRFIPNYHALKSLIGKLGSFDVAYVFGLSSIGSGIVMAPTEAGIPVLHHCGDAFLGLSWPNYNLSSARRLMFKTVLKEVGRIDFGADRRNIAFVSRFLEQQVRDTGYPLQNVHILPRGIEFPVEKDQARERDVPFTFMMAARITPDKGLAVAVEAAILLQKSHGDLPWRVDIYGKTDEVDHPGHLAMLKEMAARGGVTDRFRWNHQVPREEILVKLRKCGAFINSSTWGEPFANTIIEALGAGAPLIGALSGSILEVVEPETHALVYEARNPAELARHMARVLSDPKVGELLARAGASRIEERYLFSGIMDKTEKLLEQVCKEKPLPT